jgi:hypothetical protein
VNTPETVSPNSGSREVLTSQNPTCSPGHEQCRRPMASVCPSSLDIDGVTRGLRGGLSPSNFIGQDLSGSLIQQKANTIYVSK